jgi:hypothetical protein
MWQQDDDGRQRDWDGAVRACGSLSLGGHSDWRLPSMTELSSLYKNAGSKSEVRKKYFPGMKSEEVVLPSGSVGPYWSSDLGPDSIPNSRIVVSFHDGSLQAAQVGGFSGSTPVVFAPQSEPISQRA